MGTECKELSKIGTKRYSRNISPNRQNQVFWFSQLLLYVVVFIVRGKAKENNIAVATVYSGDIDME